MFRFEPTTIDGAIVGRYWATRRDAYAQYAQRPPVVEAGMDLSLLPEIRRHWLVSENEEWVAQLQFDRLIVNWRKRKHNAYPGFSIAGGVADKAVDEWRRFAAFMDADMLNPVTLTRIELSKVDLLFPPILEHGPEPFARMFPSLDLFARNGRKPPYIAQWQEPTDGFDVTCDLRSVKSTTAPHDIGVRLEFRIGEIGTAAIEGASERLRAASKSLNKLFEGLVQQGEVVCK